jgi:hypothetical protein
VIEIYVVVAATLVIIGAVVGGIAVVSLGIRREEREMTLTDDITDRAARGVRRVNGVYTRGYGSAPRTGDTHSRL